MNPPDTNIHAPVVLIADDDALMRSLMTAALTEKDFDVLEATDGREALDQLSRRHVDLVMLDVDMPGLDGFETCALIREASDTRDIPVIIVTGNENTDSIDHAFRVGATDFVSKPVNWSLIGYRARYVLRAAQTRSALATSESHNRALLEALPDRLISVDAGGRILAVIDGGDQARESDGEDLSGRALEAVLPAEVAGDARAAVSRTLRSGQEASLEFSEPPPAAGAGGTSYYEIRVLPHGSDVALLIVRDVSVRKQTEQQMHRLAYFDSLTGLPNRHFFMRRCAAFVADADPASSRLVLCYFNLDHFKRINDTLGHQAGDDVLQQIGERLRDFAERQRADGHYLEIARLGSDEFVLLADVAHDRGEEVLTANLRAQFAAPFPCGRHHLVITQSGGSAIYPEDGSDLATLLMNADKAMSSAKGAGRDTHRRYSRVQHEPPANVIEMESELRQAIEHNELVLYFQPKLDLETGHTVGAEALLRWIRPGRGMVSPGLFIPVAEETGLIVDIDRWVVEEACRQQREWLDQGLDVVPVSVNLSGREFCFDQPEVTLQRALARYRIDAGLLEVEITETVLMTDPASATETLRRIREMGIAVAVDDFGTGYSSLGYLKHFPLDVLKIDQSFVSDLETDDNDRALCRAMISVAAALDLQVVAEGIETDRQRDYLKEQGCGYGQGYLFYRPMEARSFAELLEAAGTTAPLSTAGAPRSSLRG